MNVDRILVPVDFSEGSSAALDFALQFAKKFGAQVDLLHVWEPPGYVPLDTALASIGTGPPKTIAEIARSSAARDMAALAQAADGDVGTQRVESGDASDTIVKVAGDDGYHCIVMGTHGRRGLSRLALGSVAARVVRNARCPVVTVTAPPRRSPAHTS